MDGEEDEVVDSCVPVSSRCPLKGAPESGARMVQELDVT